MEDEVERLLGAEEAAKADEKADDAAPKAEGGKADEGADKASEEARKKGREEALLKEVSKLREDRREDRAVIDELKAVVKPLMAMKNGGKEDEPSADLSTQEAWLGHIDKKSAEAVQPVLSDIEKLKEAHKSKALKAFVKEHPEYSPSADGGKERLKALLEKHKAVRQVTGRSELDADEVLEDLKDSWALIERSQVEMQYEKMRRMGREADADAAEIAMTGGGSADRSSGGETDATPEIRRAAKELDIPLAEYMKLRGRIPW